MSKRDLLGTSTPFASAPNELRELDEWLRSLPHDKGRKPGHPYGVFTQVFVFMQMAILMEHNGLTMRAAARQVVNDNYHNIMLDTGLAGTPESITRWVERQFKKGSFYTAAGKMELNKKSPLTPAERQRLSRARRRLSRKV